MVYVTAVFTYNNMQEFTNVIGTVNVPFMSLHSAKLTEQFLLHILQYYYITCLSHQYKDILWMKIVLLLYNVNYVGRNQISKVTS